ncbi:MAG: type I DNA topoisomerase [Spirochaetales bacterium]|nr:type I DNA topoisomerase [Spirochaetales bacterium]
MAENTTNKLIIVESPTKARTISKFLPSDCTVLASNGHIRALPEDSLSIDVEHGYKPRFEIIEGKQKVIAQIQSALKKADELILATDEDREGESISWHLVEVLKPKVPYRRMVFHEITRSAILQAFAGGRDIDMNLVNAQEARRILDRLFGYSISPILWKKLSNKKLSAGRVQSPGLRLIVEREKARMAFRPGCWWGLRARFSSGRSAFEARLVQVGERRVADGKSFDAETGEYKGKKNTLLLDEASASELASRLRDGVWTVSSTLQRPLLLHPAAPFTTSTLQQEGNRKLRLSAKDTMRIAQTLYERGFITYMRTDSPALSSEGTKAARAEVASVFGEEYLSASVRRYSARSANAQEAHEAIRPATVDGHFTRPEDTGLSGRELGLYSMIYKRTVACQMADARKTAVTMAIAVDDCLFECTGTRTDFPGFIRVYVEGRDEDETEENGAIPELADGTVLAAQSLEPVSHETKMPVRYTEATLVQALEKMGIGRPSTYAAIIDRIMEKQYVVKESNSLVPTFSGFGVIQLLQANFPGLIDYDFTKDMENSLDLLARGEMDELSYLKQFYEGENGLRHRCAVALKAIDAASAKQIVLPQLSPENQVFIGPYGAYVKSGSKNISIPPGTFPSSVTDEAIEALRSGESQSSDTGPRSVCTLPTGEEVYLMEGRYGKYWQIGLGQNGQRPRRVSVPPRLRPESVTPEMISNFFELPKVLGQNPEGTDVSIGISKYGPYVACGKEFRSVANYDILFSLSLETALQTLSAPKPERRSSSSKKGKTSSSAPAGGKKQPVVDFGDHEGQNLAILFGRYGYYLRHGDKNYRLPADCRSDEAACRALTKEQAVACLSQN